VSKIQAINEKKIFRKKLFKYLVEMLLGCTHSMISYLNFPLICRQAGVINGVVVTDDKLSPVSLLLAKK
jgi:hypothetical protein